MQIFTRLFKILLFNLFVFYSFQIITCEDTLSATENGEKIGSIELIDYSKLESLKQSSKFFVVVTIGKNCGIDCNEKLSIFEDLKSSLYDLDGENEINIYFSKDLEFHKRYSVKKSPKILFFRSGAHLIYKDDLIKDKIIEWISENREKVSSQLDDSSFEHDTQAATGSTTGDWFVMFHKENCGTRILNEDTWESASLKLKGVVNFAYVNTDKSPVLTKRFDIKDSPTIIFFRQGFMYRYEIKKIDIESLTSFSSGGWYRNVKAHTVPKETTYFDFVLDYIIHELKNDNKIIWYGLYVTISVILAAACLLAYGFTKPSAKDAHNKSD